MAKVLGIDLRTTKSCMAVMEDGEAGGTPEGSKKDEGPIIDAEVVDDKRAA